MNVAQLVRPVSPEVGAFGVNFCVKVEQSTSAPTAAEAAASQRS